jgi:hypothetical protein
MVRGILTMTRTILVLVLPEFKSAVSDAGPRRPIGVLVAASLGEDARAVAVPHTVKHDG